ncbi:MAG: type II toxin-antitoxin system RelE/ParE family toxin [Bacillus sp. (in: Bacteria)]|nr:type II toxin-antitoxin system RelE/ParE family toxin [Bacillus sp. (in: firmicutes)]MCM1427243.1 type II toxin-antitoxin system RelE/ParE family toxin [Eubacterium sp.]
MEYKVVVTSQAKAHFREIVHYLRYELESRQAATNIADDFKETIDWLSTTANSFKLCDDEILRAKGYRTIHLRRHKYLLVYSIHNNTAYVEGIYHDLQDYENALK